MWKSLRKSAPTFKWLIEAILPPLIRMGGRGRGEVVAGIRDNTCPASCVFWADLVTLPVPLAFLATALMTPKQLSVSCQEQQNNAEEDRKRSAQHMWVCQQPYQQWLHHQISRRWGHLPAFSPEQQSISFSPANLQAVGAV